MNPIAKTLNGGRYRDAPPRHDSARTLARGLGWLSIGLGLAEVLRPREVAQVAGTDVSDGLMRGYGARELLTGVGLLTTTRPEPYVWARVAGDVVDIATVGSGSISGRSPQRSGAAVLALLGVTAVDVMCAIALRREARQRKARAPVNYGDRSGFPRGLQQMRGEALRGHTQRSAVGRASLDSPGYQAAKTS